MQLQTVEIEGKTYALIQDGKPVYKGDDGKEIAFDAVHATQKISSLNAEAKSHREAKEAAEGKLKGFEGITDTAAALKALETVKNLDDKKLLDAGQVEQIKAEAIKAVEERYKPIQAERDTFRGQLDGMLRSTAFGNSKFVADKVAVPRHMLERTYGDNFKIEDGKLVPYDASGNKLFSRARPGEVADFDEAIELLVSADPFKDHILKGTTGAGGGAGQGGGAGGGSKTITRADFAKLTPAEQMSKTTKDGFTVTD